MNDSLKKFKIIIIVLIVLILIIGGIILILKKDNSGGEIDVSSLDTEELEKIATLNDEDIYQNALDAYQPDLKATKVDDDVRYYKAKNIVDKYFSELNNVNINPQTELQKEDSDMSVSMILEMLNDEYKKQFSITEETVLHDAELYKGKMYNINSMYTMSKLLDVRIFLIEIDIQDIEAPIYFLISIDYSNMAFEIYGDEYVRQNGYDINADNLVNFEAKRIELVHFNKLENVNVTKEDMAINYFYDYKYKALNDYKKAFDVLQQDYREKRFLNMDDYYQYVQENLDYLNKMMPVRYIFNDYQDYNEYVCEDQYGNLYVFNEFHTMDYTVRLDTYTLTTDKFQKEYAEGNDSKKVIMNIDKFVKMINNYDYRSAYNVLNDTFKDNNFGSVENFKEYMQKTYYRFNDIVLKDYSVENDVFVYKATISNKFNNEEKKDFNVIMKLNEGTEFEMSFEII